MMLSSHSAKDSLERVAEQRQFSEKFRVEAGSNTSNVTLRVVGDDENGSLESETVKYGHEYKGTQTQERLRWQGTATCT
jgi:hypothetical protein